MCKQKQHFSLLLRILFFEQLYAIDRHRVEAWVLNGRLGPLRGTHQHYAS
jgi:hypothetical protein